MGDKDNPAPRDSWHDHRYYDGSKKKWVKVRCNCATSKDHITPREDNDE